MTTNCTAASDNLTHEVKQQGWHAQLDLGFKKTPVKTVLNKRSRKGPLSVQRAFYPEQDVCHVYILHPPGGVVGGDRLEISLDLDCGSHALLTTPGASKFYRSAGDHAVLKQVFHVRNNAVLEWLPQENIFFPGSHVINQLQIHLEGNARTAAWEIQCLGRPVINEAFETGFLDSHWKIFRDNRPLLIERLRVDNRRLRFRSHLNNHAVTGSFIITGIDKQLLDRLRAKTVSNNDESLAMTLIEDLLLVRYLGDSTENARRYFSDIWSNMREPAFGRKALTPRIWNT